MSQTLRLLLPAVIITNFAFAQTNNDEYPDWKTLPQPAVTNQSKPHPFPSTPPAKDFRTQWAEGGGLVGVLERAWSYWAAMVNGFLFGSAPLSPPPPTSAIPPPKDFLPEVEAATVTIEFATGSAQTYDTGATAGGATGFLLNYQEKKFIVTNIHVLLAHVAPQVNLVWTEGALASDGSNLRVRQTSRLESSFQQFLSVIAVGSHKYPIPPARAVQPPGIRSGTLGALAIPSSPPGPSLLLSAGRDVALIPITTGAAGLDVAHEAPSKGDEVFVVGNPAAEHTLHVMRGTITAVGPDRLELSVPGLQPGMSGSAVVSAKTGKVLAVVSYLVNRPNFQGKNLPATVTSIRQFAYRLDNLTDLQSFPWGEFVRQVGALRAIDERTVNVWRATDLPLQTLRDRDFFPDYKMSPDSDSSVPMRCTSMVGDLERLLRTEPNAMTRQRWASYQRELELALRLDISPPPNTVRLVPPITIPYLQGILRTVVAKEREFVASYLRQSAGMIPTRNE